MKLKIVVEPYSIDIVGKTNSKLVLSHHHDIVVRKSNYIDSRTLSISCNLASADLPSNMIRALKDSATKGIMRIIVE